MKIYINLVNENWVVDNVISEWNNYQKELTTKNIRKADIIWIISPWTWKKLPKSQIRKKKVICTIHHIDFYKFEKLRIIFEINRIFHGEIIEDIKDNLILDKFEDYKYIGKLMTYDTQTIGQDDVSQSNYLFRIDKLFIEDEKNITLQKYYMTLTEECGINIECINLTEPYDAPHLSYAFQWLFFAICLSIVILRKNKLI